MRIAFFIHSLEGGGAERVTVNLANCWSALGWNVTVITIADIDSDVYALNDGVGRKCLSLYRRSDSWFIALKSNAARIRRLRSAVLEAQADVVIAMSTSCSILAIFALAFSHAKVIATEHIHPDAKKHERFWSAARWLTYWLASARVGCSESIRAWIERHLPFASSDHIPNPLVLPLTRSPPIRMPPVAFGSTTNLMLAAGRLTHDKGFDLLIEAFAEFSLSEVGWVLVILGEGAERPALEKRIAHHGLTSSILLPGRVGNPGDWYEAASLFVLSSRYEGFPNVLLEAMSYGCPVIAVDCPSGPAEIVTPYKNGLLVPLSDNHHSLAQAMLELAESPPLCDQFRLLGPMVVEQYSINAVTHHWQTLFRRLGLKAD